LTLWSSAKCRASTGRSAPGFGSFDILLILEPL
jgi:hypothetical protein